MNRTKGAKPSHDRQARQYFVDDALTGSDPDDLRCALDAIAGWRRELDDLERRAVDAARRAGISWTDIARAQGLRSRQAAEQRRLRLDRGAPDRDVATNRQARRRLRDGDRTAGPRIARLRAAASRTADTISAATPPGHHNLARLAQQTLRVAVDAPAGVLVDLAGKAADDLSAIPRSSAPALTGALDALASALAAVRRLDSRDDQ